MSSADDAASAARSDPGAAQDRRATFEARGATELVITRAVEAPRELVFAAWTDPRHLPQWLGRGGWTMILCLSDPRPGGVRRFGWRNQDGVEMGVRGHYQAVTAPEGFVCTECFDGSAEVYVNSVRLREQAGTTVITSTIRYPSEDSRNAALRSAMQAGFSESLLRLADLLTRMPQAVTPS